MTLGAVADPVEVAEAMALLASTVGKPSLERRWAELEAQRRSVLRRPNAEQAYGLELAHRDAVKGGAPGPGRAATLDARALMRLYSFAVNFRRLHAVLGEEGRIRLAGSLRRHYLGDVGLGPLAYETTIAHHLSRMGFRIEPHDIEQGGGFDFLAIDADGTEIEIECKHLSPDVGRKIHREHAYTLLELLEPVLAENHDAVPDGQVLVVEVPDRLDPGRSSMEEIVGLAAAAFRAPDGRAEGALASVWLTEEDADRPDTLWDSGRSFGARFGRLGIVLRSAKGDGVVARVREMLKKDAMRQFSTLRPSVLFVHLSDLTGTQLVELALAQKEGVTAIQAMVKEILSSRRHVSGLSLTAPGELVADAEPVATVGERGVSFHFSKLSPGDPAYLAVRCAIRGPERW